MSLVLFGIVYVFSKITGVFEQNLLTGSNNGAGNIIGIILVAILVFLSAMLFQWIYGINFNKQSTEPTSFIFLIDDSGSMESSDPFQERYNAISDVLEGMPDSFSYMVYGFSNSSYVIRNMAPISDGLNKISGNSSGGTAIRETLNQVLDDYNNCIWSGGTNPKVILLTDGYATDIGLFRPINRVLKKYASLHISISTVGLGDVDTSLMTRIAKSTGGVFIDVSDASGLSDAMNIAANAYTSRDLLSARYQASYNILYGLLRVVFLTILGVGIGFGAILSYGLQDTLSFSMISSLLTSLIGALIMELGTGLFGLSDNFMWLLLWLFVAITIAVKPVGHHGVTQRTLKRPTMSPSSSSRNISKY